MWTCNHQSNIGFVFPLPFLLTANHCAHVCASPTCMFVSPAASLADKNASPHTAGRRSKATTSPSRHVSCDCGTHARALWPFSYMRFDTSPPSAQFVSRHSVSTCYCRPPAWLRVCRSVCQPASGLRREASFIKRKQAGDEDMRTVNLLEM